MRSPHNETVRLTDRQIRRAGSVLATTSLEPITLGRPAQWMPAQGRHDGGETRIDHHSRHAGLVPASTAPLLQGRKAETHREIFPSGVIALDDVLLIVARPLLDPLLCGNNDLHRIAGLEPDEALDAV